MGSLATRIAGWIALIALGFGCPACLGPGDETDGLGASPGELLTRAPDDQPRSTYLRLEAPGRAAQESLGRQLDLDRVAGDTVWAYASPDQLAWLDAKGLAYERLPHPGFNPGARMGLLDRAGRAHWDHFPTYAEYVQVMQQLASTYPSLCRLVNLGPSTNLSRPHAQWALKISKNPDLHEDEPEVLLTSTMHGDETTGYILLLKLAEELVSTYASDAEVRGLVDNLEIWLNPLANPDGTYYASDTSVNGAIREYTDASGDAAWMDPNRNFPDPVIGDHPDGEVWWRETQNMMALASQRSFVLSGNFHGGAEVVNYPWDHKPELHPDDAWLILLSRGYADLCQADGWAGYMTELDDGITNGYAWYQTQGSRQDYMTFFQGGREVTLEVSGTKNPDAADLPAYWTANRRALLTYLGQALKGVRGTVTNVLGEPLDAAVTVLNHDTLADASAVATDPAVGDYHRLLAPGTYSLRFTAEGYLPRDFAGVVVGAGAATRLDVVLSQAARADFVGRVLDERGMPVVAARVELVDTARPAQLTRRSGDFRFPDLPEGNHTVRVSLAGYETLEQECLLQAGTRGLVLRLYRQVVIYATSLEADDGGLRPGGGPAPGWQWGAADGLGSHSASRVWSTALNADYVDDATYRLELGKVRLPLGNPRLTFWHAYATESGYDGGRLELSADGGASFQPLTPAGGYPQANVSALGGPGWAGTSGWTQASFDLSAWAGQNVIFRWVFASDGSQTDAGWSLDDILVTGRKLP